MEKAVLELFDRQGVLSEFTVDCLDCPIHLRIADGTRGPGRGDCYCKIIKKDCPWVTHSKKANGTMSVAPSAKVFKKYGFKLVNDKSTYKIGKCHFLFFLYHPDMNWEPPKENTERTRFGKIIKATDIWEMCHINGICWDDRKRNLQWGRKTEHKVLEPNTKGRPPKTLHEAGIP